MTVNMAASVRQRLRNLARDQGVDYNRLQLLYVQERWLARLAHSSDGFVHPLRSSRHVAPRARFRHHHR